MAVKVELGAVEFGPCQQEQLVEPDTTTRLGQPRVRHDLQGGEAIRLRNV